MIATGFSAPTQVAAIRRDFYEQTAEAVRGILCVFTTDGHCNFVSRRWEDYTGAKLAGGRLETASNWVHPEDIAKVKEAWKLVAHQGKPFEVELRLRRHDGLHRWHSVRVVPDSEHPNKISQWIGIAVDIDDGRKDKSEAVVQTSPENNTEELERTVAERTSQLQEVNEQLEAFAYSIAHDMRAPLRAMHQYAQTVAQDFGSQVPAEAKVYLNRIMAASEKLDTLIREVLVYTKVSQGRIDLQPMNLERLLSEILIMHPQLNPPNVELSARLPLHSVIGDETALTQAFSNLLTNATKFVPKGRRPKVEVWTEEIGEQVRICIKDNGIGIPQRDRGRIFKMFERLQPESQYEGSGIGLTIVRRAVERMNGKIGVDSTEGEGSTFWIELKKGNLW